MTTLTATTTRPPGPLPDSVATARGLLRPHLTDPDTYWPTLVMFLTMDIEALRDIHRADCHTPGCDTCRLIADLVAIIGAHDAIQPSGCACPDHITYPRRPAVTGK